MSDKLQYGNWIRWKVLLFLGVGAVGFALLGLCPLPAAARIGAELLSILLFISLLYPGILYYMFAPQGGNLQERVYNLIVEELGGEVDGRAIDIGTGNGILAVRLAQEHPLVQVTGLDSWGRDWDYSNPICARNARVAGVEQRIRFVKGDAARLEFEDGSFDAAVSNLTFHEVKSAPQKREVVREALRVLKPGGRFVFVDYFYAEKYYGKTAGFEDFLASQGLKRMQLKPLSQVLPFPRLLRHPKALGRVGILYGVK